MIWWLQASFINNSRSKEERPWVKQYIEFYKLLQAKVPMFHRNFSFLLKIDRGSISSQKIHHPALAVSRSTVTIRAETIINNVLNLRLQMIVYSLSLIDASNLISNIDTTKDPTPRWSCGPGRSESHCTRCTVPCPPCPAPAPSARWSGRCWSSRPCHGEPPPGAPAAAAAVRLPFAGDPGAADKVGGRVTQDIKIFILTNFLK